MKAGPAEFFNAAHDAFLFRSNAKSIHRRNYDIADLTCTVEIAGDELATRLGRALAHRSAPSSSQARLTICAWDGAMVRPPWKETDYGSRGMIRGFNTERFCTMFDHGTSSLSMLDRERGLALFWTRSGAELPAYETGAPFRAIFSWWMEGKNRVLVHAGAVAAENNAVLLAGPGGSGKSTAALLCLRAGWKYLADDYCVISAGDPPRIFNLYDTAKVARTWLLEAPQLKLPAGADIEMHEDKQLFFLHELCPTRLANSVNCGLCLLPFVSGQTSTALTAATQGEALRALAPSTIFQTAVSGDATLNILAQIIRKLSVFRLGLGTALDEIPLQMDRFLKHA